MKKVVVMASGEGSNFSAIVNSGIEVAQLISDNKNANVLKRAEKAGVETRLLTPDYRGREEHEKRISFVMPEDTELVVLAGYMRIFSPWFIERWKNKIINIHPSLLPAFGGGCHAIRDAWKYGCIAFGITVHWVTEEIDAGPIIEQRAIHKFDNDTLETMTNKIHGVEHYTYPAVNQKNITRRNQMFLIKYCGS